MATKNLTTKLGLEPMTVCVEKKRVTRSHKVCQKVTESYVVVKL